MQCVNSRHGNSTLRSRIVSWLTRLIETLLIRIHSLCGGTEASVQWILMQPCLFHLFQTCGNTRLTETLFIIAVFMFIYTNACTFCGSITYAAVSMQFL